MTTTRRHLIKAGAAAAVGASLPLPLICRALAASGKIVAGMEAGSPYDTFYKKHAAEFTKASGVEVEFISIPHDNIRQQFVLDALSGAGGFDVYIADQVWLPEFYQKGFIKDLSGHVTDADRGDFSKTAIETVSYQGALVALPIMVHNCAMYYRTDLFEKAGLKAPPASWDEYLDFAKKTTDTAAGVWGTLIASKQGIEASTRLHSFYQQAGGDLLGADGKPTINSDAGRAALEFMSKMVFEAKAAPEGVLELTDMQGMWLEGKLAMAPVWPYLYSLSKEPLGRQVRDRHGAGPREPWRHGLLLGSCRCQRREESGRRDRVHQMGDEHGYALRLRQGVAEPGAARLFDRIDRQRHQHRRRRQGGDRGLRQVRGGRQEYDHGSAILAAARHTRHHEFGRDEQGDDHRAGACRRAIACRDGDGNALRTGALPAAGTGAPAPPAGARFRLADRYDRRRSLTGIVLTLPALIALALTMVYPVAWTIWLSLNGPNTALSGTPDLKGFGNYVRIAELARVPGRTLADA